jgi:hypothetical protein
VSGNVKYYLVQFFFNGDSELERNYVFWHYVMWALTISIEIVVILCPEHKYYKKDEGKTDFNHQDLCCTIVS